MVALAALFVVQFSMARRDSRQFGILGMGLLVYCTFLKPVQEMIARCRSVDLLPALYGAYPARAADFARTVERSIAARVFALCDLGGDTTALLRGPRLGPAQVGAYAQSRQNLGRSHGFTGWSMLVAYGLVQLAALLQKQDICRCFPILTTFGTG